MFFCRSDVPHDSYTLVVDKSASIVGINLSDDVSNQNLLLSSRSHCDAITTRNFPQYKPPIKCTGNVFALTYNELPRQREVATEFNHLRGTLQIKQEYKTELDVKVYCVVIYKDSFVEIDKHVVRRGRDLF